MRIRSCRYLAFATCVMSILLCARADAQTIVDERYSIKTGPAAVLLSPSSSSVIVATVAAGTRVHAEKVQGDWYLVRLPKAADEPAPVSGWIPAAMLSRVRADMSAVGTSGYIEPQARVAPVLITAGPGPGLLDELRSQRTKVDAAIQALDGVADAQALRVRRDKLDRAINATEALNESDALVAAETRPATAAAIAAPSIAASAEPVTTPAQMPNPALSYRPGVERKGFLIGLSVGGGGFSGKFQCGDCGSLSSGGAGTFQIGGMLTDKLGLMYDGSADSSSKNDDPRMSTVGTVAVQYWVGNKSWIKGGAGFGTHTFLNDECCTETGLALMGGAGVELLQKRKFVLDLQGRVTTTKFEFESIHMFLVSLGFNWY